MPKAISDLVLSGPSLEFWIGGGTGRVTILGKGGVAALASALPAPTWLTLGRGGAAGVGRGRAGAYPGTPTRN